MARRIGKLPECLLPACFPQVKGVPWNLQRFTSPVSAPQVFQDSPDTGRDTRGPGRAAPARTVHTETMGELLIAGEEH
ncbi:hypothetical protein ACWGI8_13420 [Streptomyces sp. NPDC054841]